MHYNIHHNKGSQIDTVSEYNTHYNTHYDVHYK